MEQPTLPFNQHESFEKRLKKKITESSLPGLPQIVRAERTCSKMWWIFAMLWGTGLTVYFCTDSTLIYFTYNVVSKSRIYDTFSMKFPKVTICNLDPFTTNASIDFLANFIKNQVGENMTEFENDQDMVSLNLKHLLNEKIG